MGSTTDIAWCDCTFNPWWGCVEVSPACDHCYARTWATRMGHGVWGRDAPRRFFGDKHWAEPLRWNEHAEKRGIRQRMFVASMADWGEERDDAVGAEMARARERLWRLIEQLTAIDTLLLTKRAWAYRRLVPPEILARPGVWPGVTVERQAQDWRIVELLNVGCAGPRWLSLEPLLGAMDLCHRPQPEGISVDWLGPELGLGVDTGMDPEAYIKWLVIGCESNGRLAGRVGSYLDHARVLIDQGRTAGVAVFHKQAPVNGRVSHNPNEWPEWARVQEFPR